MGKYIDAEMKDSAGNWIFYFNDADGNFTMTRLGRLHNNMTQRSKVGGSYQDKYTKTYIGVTVSAEFRDRDKFADWCVQQVGWGLGYSLDKDLLIPGNRVYCRESCVFLPQDLNSSIIRKAPRGELPQGVYRTNRADKPYFAQTGKLNKKYLGTFDTIEEAATAFKEEKERQVKELANQYRDTIDPRAYEALMLWSVNRNS